MMKLKIYGLVILGLSCYNNQTNNEKRVLYIEQPFWMDSEFRNNPDYYHGFGQVEKIGRKQDYIKECNEIVLSQISNAIKVNVNYQSTRVVFESESLIDNSNSILTSSFNLKSEINSSQLLSKIKNVGVWEDESHYYIYKRLLITDYENYKKQIVESAFVEFQKGREYFSSDMNQSLRYFFNSYNSLYPFLGENLAFNKYETEYSTFEVDIKINIRDLLNKLSINTLTDTIPLSFYGYLENQLNIETGIINNQKFIPLYFPVNSVISKDKSKITLSPDLKFWVEDNEIQELIIAEFRNYLNNTEILIDPEPTKILINYSDSSVYENPGINRIHSTLIKILNENMNAVIVTGSTNADYILTLNINAEISGKIHSLFTARASLDYFMSNEDGIIFSGFVPAVKGSQMTEKGAIEVALINLSQNLKGNFSKQYNRGILESSN